MKLLAIETATEACSAAVIVDDDIVVRHELVPRRHAELILGMVDKVLAEAGLGMASLDGLAFGRGPGSFTGVRIATGVVQGLALGADLPVAPVSSLQAVAQGALREHGHQRVLAAFDARMSEVYWGAFTAGDDGLMRPLGDEHVQAPSQVKVAESGTDWATMDWAGAGEGWAQYAGELQAALGLAPTALLTEARPYAADVALLGRSALQTGEVVDAADALPVYLRERVTFSRSST